MRVFCSLKTILFVILFFSLGSLAFADTGKAFKEPTEKIGAQAGGGAKGLFDGSSINDPRAIDKEGFFGGVGDGRVTLQNMKTYRNTTYRLEENYRVLYEGAEITVDDIPPSSIVTLIMIEGQIREIILLQRSS